MTTATTTGETPVPPRTTGETPVPPTTTGETPLPPTTTGETPLPPTTTGETPVPPGMTGETPVPPTTTGETPLPPTTTGETPLPLQLPSAPPRPALSKRMNAFERCLTAWVAVCMAAGVALGRLAPELIASLRGLELGSGSQINAPIAVLIWLMIVPMMMKIDFAALANVGKRPRGLLVTLFVNWIVKPFSMALLGWLFFKHLFQPLIGAELADQYTAGVIILAAAPCTAMVFVWSYLTDGDPAYTLVQVSINDLIMLVLFAPLVQLLVSGASALTVPFGVLLTAVIVFIVVPLAIGVAVRSSLVRIRGRQWFEKSFLPRFQPLAVTALLATLVLIFAFQADNILGHPLHVALIAVPILVQVYFNASLTYGLMRLLGVSYPVAAPGALIGASNFFELAVATAIALYGPGSGAALATVVGVLVEVPVMLSVCAACNRTRHWFTEVEV
ncbi:MAG TPA: ACR3 family arsenite efflux transporter [Gemmataceae bacterium]|nr:ACR3 family arsenite efflux transporter [Gemmataceae bacterium]